MASETSRANGFLAVAPGTRLLGEIITWNCSGVTIRYTGLIDALREAKLDESVARELAPRHAFSRACRKLSQARIIRQVKEDEDSIEFQFTQESKKDDRYTYTTETLVTLEKAKGKVTCHLPGLATQAQELLDECIAARNGGDVTRVIQRLFERKADLFPIREQGGCYFVPEMHASFLDQVGGFVTTLKGNLRRYPVPAGTAHGDRSVKEAVACGMAELIAEHNAAITSFGKETRPDTLDRAAERIRITRHKIQCYSLYLAEEREKLDKDLTAASDRLRERVAELAAA
jgi:hypothetical protein